MLIASHPCVSCVLYLYVLNTLHHIFFPHSVSTKNIVNMEKIYMQNTIFSENSKKSTILNRWSM